MITDPNTPSINENINGLLSRASAMPEFEAGGVVYMSRHDFNEWGKDKVFTAVTLPDPKTALPPIEFRASADVADGHPFFETVIGYSQEVRDMVGRVFRAGFEKGREA